MSQDSSSSDSTPELDTTPYFDFDGMQLYLEDMPILKAALSTVEDLLKEKRPNVVRLSVFLRSLKVIWHDGEEWMEKEYPWSSTTTEPESSK